MKKHIDQKQIDDQIEIAINLKKSGELGKAKLLYESLLFIQPNAFKILYLLGTLEAQSCNFDKSLSYLIKANNINSNSWEVNSNIGNAYF